MWLTTSIWVHDNFSVVFDGSDILYDSNQIQLNKMRFLSLVEILSRVYDPASKDFKI